MATALDPGCFTSCMVQQMLVGAVIQWFEKLGFQLVGMKMSQAPESILAVYLQGLRRKQFFPVLTSYLSSWPVVSTVWEGYSVVPLLSKDHSRTHSLNWCTPHVHHRRHYCSHHQQVIIHVSECCSGPRRYCCDLEGQTVDPDRELSPTAAAIQSAVSFSTLIFFYLI